MSNYQNKYKPSLLADQNNSLFKRDESTTGFPEFTSCSHWALIWIYMGPIPNELGGKWLMQLPQHSNKMLLWRSAATHNHINKTLQLHAVILWQESLRTFQAVWIQVKFYSIRLASLRRYPKGKNKPRADSMTTSITSSDLLAMIWLEDA